jgi:phospholipid/cholesterol/gamma-HCH transport system substrate-binding protein
LLGTKAIKIEKSEAGVYYESGDTIRSSLSEDMISELLDGLPPLLSTVNAAVSTLDSVARSIQVILNDPAIAQILEDLDGVTSSIDEQLSSSGDLSRSFSNLRSISENLNAQNEAISQSITNFEDLSAQLKDAELDSLIKHLSGVGSNLESISKSIESGEGAIGKLIFEDSLYQQISMLMAELDTLVNDINENPKKYVGFSIFGK